jgi:hypothetical protein
VSIRGEKMPKFTPPFVYVDRDSFLEEEAKYQHELDQEDLEREWLREWLEGPAAGGGMPYRLTIKK